MRAHSLSHLSDADLIRGLASLAAQDRANKATLLAHLAEADARRLTQRPADEQLAPGQVEADGPDPTESPACQLAPGPVDTSSELVPGAPEPFLLRLTIGRSTLDRLRYAQALLGDEVPSGDLSRVVERAFEALIRRLEKSKPAANGRRKQRRVPPQRR
jgi:hypothetical protein